MKAFIATSIYTYSRDEDILILAKTKKDAMTEFKRLRESTFMYKAKDFKEAEIETLEVYGMDIVSRNYKHYKDSNTPRHFCFEPRFQLRLKDDKRWNNPDQTILAETEQTYKLIIKIFKQQNKEMLLELF